MPKIFYIYNKGYARYQMEKINNISSYNRIIAVKQDNNEETPVDFKGSDCQKTSEYMTSDTSAASRAYGLSFINKNKTIQQMSLKDMIKQLESQGKVEGKDFEINSACTMGNTVLTVKNKQGQEVLMVHYDNGNHNTWNCYEVTEYKDGKKSKQTSRDSNGNLMCISNFFDKNDARIKPLTEGKLSYDTKPEEYIKYLKDNNMDYSVEYYGEEENNRGINIKIYDANKKVTNGIWYYYGENKFDDHCIFVSQSSINEEGEEYRRIGYNKDNIEVVTYANYN